MVVPYSKIKVDKKLLDEWREQKEEHAKSLGAGESLAVYLLGYSFYLCGFPEDTISCLELVLKSDYPNKTHVKQDIRAVKGNTSEDPFKSAYSRYVQLVFNCTIVQEIVKKTGGSVENFSKICDDNLDKKIEISLHKELMGHDSALTTYFLAYPTFFIEAVLKIVENQKLLKYYA